MSQRLRPIKVCTFCRSRKIKCSRGDPCEACIKYKNSKCEYVKIEKKPKPSRAIKYIEQEEEFDNDELNEEELINKLFSTESKVNEIKQLLNKDFKEDNTPTVSDNSLTPKDNSTRTTDRINFFYLYVPIAKGNGLSRRFYSPFSMVAIYHTSQALNRFYHCTYEDLSIEEKKDLLNKLPSFLTMDNNNNNSMESVFMRKFEEDEGFINHYLFNESFSGTNNTSHAFSSNFQSMGLMYLADNDRERLFSEKTNFAELYCRILDMIPIDNYVISLFIKHFFRIIYPVVPALDETSFEDTVDYILNKSLVLSNGITRLDIINLGILLMLLRITYLSVVKVHSSPRLNTTTDEGARLEEVISLNPISCEVVDMAQVCLHHSNVFNSNDLNTIQLTVLIRYYQLFGAEYGLTLERNEPWVFNSLLIQAAYGMDLHREPDKTHNKHLDERTKNLGRKLWYVSLIFDACTCFLLGGPTDLFRMTSDIELPEYSVENANNKDPFIEKLTIGLLKVFNLVGEVIKNEYFLYPDMNRFVTIEETNNYVDRILYFDDQNMGVGRINLNEVAYKLLTEEEKIEILVRKSLNMRHLYSVEALRLALFFIFFNIQLKQKNYTNSLKYLTSLLSLIYIDISTLKIYFGERGGINQTLDFMCNQAILAYLQKVFMINLSSILLSKIVVKKLDRAENYNSVLYQRLQEFIELLTTSSTKLIKYIGPLTDIYYSAWRMVKLETYFLECADMISYDDLFNDEDIDLSDNFGFTSERLKSWCNIVEIGLAEF